MACGCGIWNNWNNWNNWNATRPLLYFSSPRPLAKPLATCVSSSAALRQKLGDGGTARLAHE
ncbi:hypothetical protein [Hallella sp.]|uniref:hypothetical protein n=1 Tax=Hallella sp. TaxID=2980186 RepID=UPI00307E57E6